MGEDERVTYKSESEKTMTPSEAIESGRDHDEQPYTVIDQDPADGVGHGLYDAVALIADISWPDDTEMGLVDEDEEEVWRGTIADAREWCAEYKRINPA
jgi:hypothetical protein